MNNQFIPTKFQAVIFTNNQEITTEPSLIKKLYNEFEIYEVIPAAFNEVNIQSGGFIGNRLKFHRLDNSFSISFNLDRIDIQGNSTAGSFATIDAFTTIVNQVLTIVDSNFKKNASRIGVVAFYKADPSVKNNNKIFETTYHKIENFPAAKPTEWSNRANYRFVRQINEKSEMTNNIYTFSHGSAQILNNSVVIRSDDINLQLDINTTPEAKELRFLIDDLKSFYDQTPGWISNFIDSLHKNLSISHE